MSRCGCEVLESMRQVDQMGLSSWLEAWFLAPRKPAEETPNTLSARASSVQGRLEGYSRFAKTRTLPKLLSRAQLAVLGHRGVHEQVSVTLPTTQTHHTIGFATTGPFAAAGGVAGSSPKSDAK